MNTNQIIYLWGFMASGKSRLGKRLSSKLNFDFIDLDQYIEQKTGIEISQIFKYEGEQAFRQLETEAILACSKKENMVISCGGGCPCFNNNSELMNKLGTTVFLSVEESVLYNRLERNKRSRPLVAEINSKEKLQQFISDKLAERMPYYSTAQITYDNTYPKGDLSDLINQLSMSR